MDLSIIIVNYNTRELVLDCLSSVYEQTTSINFEVIVVDNASSDNSAEAIKEKFPQAKLIESKDNLGFAAGNNLAAEQAQGRVLILLNPDTIVHDAALNRLYEFVDSRGEDIIAGGRTLNQDGTLNPTSCWGNPSIWSLVCISTGLAKIFPKSKLFAPESLGSWQRDTVREVDIITGCLLGTRKSVWDKLCGFDEDFFMYAEDADLCMRAANKNIKRIVCPTAVITHLCGASEKIRADKMIRLFKAKMQLIVKFWSPIAASIGASLLCMWALSRLFGYKIFCMIKPAKRAGLQEWQNIWRRRSEWLRPLHKPKKNPRIMLVASSGGHWIQMMRLKQAFDNYDATYVTVETGMREMVKGSRFYVVPHATEQSKLKLIWLAMRVFTIISVERPDVIISTGAAPGLFAILFGKIFGARTLWIDSIANVTRLSKSGRIVSRFADKVYTQWPNLSGSHDAEYRGKVF